MEGTGNQPGLLLLAGEVEEIGGFWKERGLIPHPSSSPACRYDTRSPSDTGPFREWLRPFSLRMPLGTTTQARCSVHGGRKPRLQGRGSYGQV